MELKIDDFNLSLFKQLIYESLNTTSQLNLEFTKTFLKSLSVTASTSLLKIGYADINFFSNSVEPINIENDFRFFVLEGSNLKKFLDLYSELKPCSVTFTINQTPSGNFVASSIKLDGVTKTHNSKLSTVFALSMPDIMTVRYEDYQGVIDKLKYDKTNTSEFLLTKSNYSELAGLVTSLHKTISTNHTFLEFNVNDNGINVKDKVFDVNFNSEENIISKLEDEISFKILKSDFQAMNNHNWKIGTSQNSDKLILFTKVLPIEADSNSSIIFGCILTKTNNATIVSNNPEDYENDNLDIDLTDYDNI